MPPDPERAARMERLRKLAQKMRYDALSCVTANQYRNAELHQRADDIEALVKEVADGD